MHKDLWVSSRCGWGCVEGEKLKAETRPCCLSLDSSLPIRVATSARPDGKWSAIPPSSNSAPAAGPAPPSPAARGRARITRLELGRRPAFSGVNGEVVEVVSGPNPGHSNLQQGPSGGQAGLLGFRGRRRLLGGARPGRDGLRRPPTQCSPGRRHQPVQRRTGAGNAPPIGQA